MISELEATEVGGFVLSLVKFLPDSSSMVVEDKDDEPRTGPSHE